MTLEDRIEMLTAAKEDILNSMGDRKIEAHREGFIDDLSYLVNRLTIRIDKLKLQLN